MAGERAWASALTGGVVVEGKQTMAVERRLIGLLGGGAFFLLAATAVAVLSLHSSLDDVREIARGHEVIARLRSSHLAVADVETAMSGYLLTGEDRFLEPDRTARVAALSHIRQARVLREADAAQVGDLERLEALVRARFERIETTLAVRRERRTENEELARLLWESWEELVAVHDRVGVLLAREERGIADRAARTGTGATARSVAIGSISAVVLLLLLGGYILVRRELAYRRAAETRLRDANETLDALNQELKAFTYSVAHDLRSPLTVIAGYTTLLLEERSVELSGGARADIRAIHDAAASMAKLIHDLLDFSRASRAELIRTDVDVTAEARSVVSELRRAQPERAVTVDVDEGIVVWGDPALIRVALANLLGNAFKYTAKRADARAEVRDAGSADHAGFEVRDNGVGFPMGQAHRLFQPFQRLHSEGEFRGTGIGLATVQRVAERHGGHVRAHSAPGAGARFTVELPRQASGAQPVAAPAQPARPLVT
jgi:signal transduction histidine kinase